MASKKSTKISLLILGAAALLAIVYFVWLFLAPPPAVVVPTPGQAVSTGLDTGVVSGSKFQLLQEFVSLPIVAGAVGRVNPFANLPPAGSNANANANLNANKNTNASANPSGNAPVNSPSPLAPPSVVTP